MVTKISARSAIFFILGFLALMHWASDAQAGGRHGGRRGRVSQGSPCSGAGCGISCPSGGCGVRTPSFNPSLASPFQNQIQSPRGDGGYITDFNNLRIAPAIFDPGNSPVLHSGNCVVNRLDGTQEKGACVVQAGKYYMIRVRPEDGSLFIDRLKLGTEDLPQSLRNELLGIYDKKYVDPENKKWKDGLESHVQANLGKIYGKYRSPVPPPPAEPGFTPSPSGPAFAPSPPPPPPLPAVDEKQAPAPPELPKEEKSHDGEDTSPRNTPKDHPVADSDSIDCDELAKQEIKAEAGQEETFDGVVPFCHGSVCTQLRNRNRKIPKVEFTVSVSDSALVFTHAGPNHAYQVSVKVKDRLDDYQACFKGRKVKASLLLLSVNGEDKTKMVASLNYIEALQTNIPGVAGTVAGRFGFAKKKK